MGRGHLDVRGSLRDSTARWRFARRPFRARTDAPGRGGRRRLGACIERLGCWRGHWLNVVSGVVSHGRPSPFSSSPRPCAAQSGPELVRRSIDSSELKRDGTKACASWSWSACRLGEFWLQSHSRLARASPMARKVGSPPGHHLGSGCEAHICLPYIRCGTLRPSAIPQQWDPIAAGEKPCVESSCVRCARAIRRMGQFLSQPHPPEEFSPRSRRSGSCRSWSHW